MKLESHAGFSKVSFLFIGLKDEYNFKNNTLKHK